MRLTVSSKIRYSEIIERNIVLMQSTLMPY